MSEIVEMCDCGAIAQFKDTYLARPDSRDYCNTEAVRTVFHCLKCHRRNVKPEYMITTIIDEKLKKAVEDRGIPAPLARRVNFPHAWVFQWNDR